MKKILLVTIISLMINACSTTRDEGKTPRTQVGQLNGCMLNAVYDMKNEETLFFNNKWTVASQILNSCKRKLHLTSRDINETQSMSIIISVIDSLK
ncbi:MAG: hypothetical protein IJZ59_00130 [Alphaproteobacteria bacterium]|nr:hypothetical protein [Alphaproteobacteria bacterium]